MSAQPALSSAELEAHAAWVACGQAALAAVIERSLEAVRPLCPPHRWMSIINMRRAFQSIGARYQLTPYARELDLPEETRCWPRRGVALIQLSGPWEAPAIPVAASLERTHWVAVRPGLDEAQVFDVNAVGALSPDGWVPRKTWQAEILPQLVAHTRKASGRWWIRAGLELDLGAEVLRPAPPVAVSAPPAPRMPQLPFPRAVARRAATRPVAAASPANARALIQAVLAEQLGDAAGAVATRTRETVCAHPTLQGMRRWQLEALLTSMVLEGEVVELAGGRLAPRTPTSDGAAGVPAPRPGARGDRR